MKRGEKIENALREVLRDYDSALFPLAIDFAPVKYKEVLITERQANRIRRLLGKEKKE